MSEYILDREMLDSVSGGYNVDDLTPEEFAELERLGGQAVELMILQNNGDPSFDKEKLKAIMFEIQALRKRLSEKYGS